MNRRRLILTSLGALAGCLGLPKVALAIAEQKPKVSIAELFVSESAVVSGPIAGLGPKQDVPIAELYISVSQDVNEALSKETTVVSKQPPLIMIGSLIVANEAEAEAFLKRMADAIRKASQPGSSYAFSDDFIGAT